MDWSEAMDWREAGGGLIASVIVWLVLVLFAWAVL